MGVQFNLSYSVQDMQDWQVQTCRGLAALGQRIVYDSGNRPGVIVTPLEQPARPVAILLEPWQAQTGDDLSSIIHDELTTRGQIEDTRAARTHFVLRFIWSEPNS